MKNQEMENLEVKNQEISNEELIESILIATVVIAILIIFRKPILIGMINVVECLGNMASSIVTIILNILNKLYYL